MSRKREEDEDEYGDEIESDEDQDATRKPKKKKPKFGGFLDMEAEEDDVEDDEDENENIENLIAADEADAEGDDDRQQAQAQQLQRRHALQADDPEEYMKYISQRFGDEDEDEEDQAAPDTSGIDQQSLLPTIRDPSLYIVRCRKPGHERKAILTLLQKYFDLKRKGRDLGIVSAVAPEHLRGRIYIEASSSAQVEFAVNGLDLFSTFEGVKALELEEMTDVLKVGKKLDRQVPGNWVRRTRGLYKGDLAQVVRVGDGNENFVTIRLVPRPDIKGEREDMENNDNDFDDDDNPTPSNLVLNTKRRGRPPQRLFDKNEIRRLTGSADIYTQRETISGDMFDYWNQNTYRHGLVYQRVSIKGLVVGDNVQPTADEIELWVAAEEKMKLSFEEDESGMTSDEARLGLNLKLNTTSSGKKKGFFKGDSVNITKGEQKGLRGKVAGFDGDVVLMQTTDFPEPLRVSRADLVKTFEMAEHVSVVSGKHAGQSGVIVNIDGIFLTIYTDSTREHVRVLAAHVADSADVDSSMTASRLGVMNRVHYELFDLVQLQSDENAQGVVVKVKTDGIEILNAQNQRQVVPVSEVKCKVTDRSARAMDARNNPIAPNDTIHVIAGTAKDRTGVVQHVAGPTVFFKARDEVRNCGIIAIPANSCTANTAAARRLNTSANSMYNTPAPIPRGSIASLGMPGMRQGGRGGMGRGAPRSRDPLMRKDVKVIKGQWKGHRGKVVYCDDSKVRVELSAKMKTITLLKDKVVDVEDDSRGGDANGDGGYGQSRPPAGLGRFGSAGAYNGAGHYGAGGRNGARAPHHANGGRTPRPENFMQTPRQTTDRFSGPGSRTPAPSYGVTTPHPNNSFGGMTPRVGAHQTPRNNGFPLRTGTPANDSFRPSTPYDRGAFGSSLGSGMATAANVGSANAYGRGAFPRTPATPGEALNAYTPAPTTPMSYGGIIEPRTPANVLEPRTPAPIGNEPRTPAPLMEPATPAPMLEPRTPAPGIEPATPMMHSIEPQTPMMTEPQTPHTPAMVPHTPAPPNEEFEDAASMGYKVLVDVNVSVPSENGNTGVVLDADVHGTVLKVKLISGPNAGNVVKLGGDGITPVQPKSEINPHQLEMVKVLDGGHQGRMGRLTRVNVPSDNPNEATGIIQFDHGQEELLLALVAKCVDPNEPS